jgi:hypothetical protein
LKISPADFSDSVIQNILNQPSILTTTSNIATTNGYPPDQLELLLLFIVFVPRILAIQGPPTRLLSALVDQAAVRYSYSFFHGVVSPLVARLSLSSSHHQVSILSRVCQNSVSTHDRLHLYLIHLASSLFSGTSSLHHQQQQPNHSLVNYSWCDSMIPFVQSLLIGAGSSSTNACEWTEECFIGKNLKNP